MKKLANSVCSFNLREKNLRLNFAFHFLPTYWFPIQTSSRNKGARLFELELNNLKWNIAQFILTVTQFQVVSHLTKRNPLWPVIYIIRGRHPTDMAISFSGSLTFIRYLPLKAYSSRDKIWPCCIKKISKKSRNGF